MNIYLLMMIFVLGGIFGWIYEIIFYYLNSNRKKVYMRGSNFLPFINIYSIGSTLLVLINYNFRKEPLIIFLLSVLITGVLELFTGLVLDKAFHIRLWDYNKEILNFGNIGGYICLRSVLIFGLGGLFLVCGVVPVLLLIKGEIFNIISTIIFIIFIIDLLYNFIFCKIFKTTNARNFYEKRGLKHLDF